MHNLHFILVRAGSADEAAEIADSVVEGFGDDDNWYMLGGVASEDGNDDQDNHEKASRFSLSSLSDDTAAPKEGTYFARSVGLMKNTLSNPTDIQAELHHLGTELLKLSRIPVSQLDLWEITQELTGLHDVVYARQNLGDGDISEEAPKRITWSREDPPSYVWFTGKQPEWLQLTPIREVTEAIWAQMMDRKTEVNRLIDLTVKIFNSTEAVVPMIETADLPGEPMPTAPPLVVSLTLQI